MKIVKKVDFSVISTNVVDSSHDTGFEGDIWGAQFDMDNTSPIANMNVSSTVYDNVSIGDTLILANKVDNLKNISITIYIRQYVNGNYELLGRIFDSNGYTGYTDESSNAMEYVNITGLFTEQIQFSDGVYYLNTDYADSIFLYNQYKLFPVGNYVFSYDITNAKIGKFYKKIQDDSLDVYVKNEVNTSQSIIYNIIEVSTIAGETITTTTEYFFSIISVTDDELEYKIPYNIRVEYSDGTPTTNTYSDVGTTTLIRQSIPSQYPRYENVALDSVAYLVFEDQKTYIVTRKENLALFSGALASEGIRGRPLSDSAYYSEVATLDLFFKVSELNQNKPFDKYLDSEAVFPDMTATLQPECLYTHVALINVAGEKARITILNSDDSVKIPEEEFQICTVDPMNCDDILDACIPCDDSGLCINDNIRTMVIYKLPTPQNADTKVIYTVDGDAKLGSVFVGKIYDLGCTHSSAKISIVNKAFKEVNEISNYVFINADKSWKFKKGSFSVTADYQKAPHIIRFLENLNGVCLIIGAGEDDAVDIDYEELNMVGLVGDIDISYLGSGGHRKISFSATEYNNSGYTGGGI